MASPTLTPLISPSLFSLPRSNHATIPTTPASSSPPPARTSSNNPTDVVSWTNSIAGHARRGRLRDAFSTFSLMLSSSDAHPNHITFLTLLSACADFPSSCCALPFGLSLHAHILKLFPLSLSDHAVLLLNTALLDFYSKCGRTDLARYMFDRMPTRNSFAYNALIAGHMKMGEVDHAVSVFHQMPPRERDKVSWTALIDGFVKNGLLDEALQQFREFQQPPPKLVNKIEPDYVMIIALVAACTDLGTLGQGMWVHRYAMSRCSGDLCGSIRLANSLIDMYSRCGRVDLARQVFDGVGNGRRTRVTWNSMVVGFAVNGCCREALEHFDLMEKMGVRPDGVSFTGALTACSHAGLVDEGMKYYRLMQQEYSEIPMRIEHYGCVVDLLGRAGRLEEAMGVVERMMPVMWPNEVVLGSLLAACRVHENVGLAERLMCYLVDLDPGVDSNFVLLSNLYAAVGRWEGAGKVRSMMKASGIKKSPGCSAVEISGDLHEFVSGDRGHMQSESIYGMLELLSFGMKLPHYDCYDYQFITFASGSSDGE